MENKPNAFLLLISYSKYCSTYHGNPDGLIIGQCHLQHWSKYKLTEREYRTAKEYFGSTKTYKNN